MAAAAFLILGNDDYHDAAVHNLWSCPDSDCADSAGKIAAASLNLCSFTGTLNSSGIIIKKNRIGIGDEDAQFSYTSIMQTVAIYVTVFYLSEHANQTCTETNQGSHKACYEKVKSPPLNRKKLSASYMLSVMDAGNFVSRSLNQQSRPLSVNFLSCYPIVLYTTKHALCILAVS